MTSATARIGWIGRDRTAVGWRLGELAEAAHAVARVGIGALFLQHGLQKLFGVMGGFMGAAGETAPWFSLMGLAGVLELGGGILLIAGLAVRPIALLLAGQMVTAFFMAHSPQGGWPIQNGGELPLLFASAFTLLAAKGAGKASLDHWLAQRRNDGLNN